MKKSTKIIPAAKKVSHDQWAMQIGERVQRLRLSIGMTQDEFAKTISLKGRHSLAMIESGRNFPTLRVLTAIFNHYHISYEYMLLGTKPQKDVESDEEIKRLKDENKKLREYIDLLKSKK